MFQIIMLYAKLVIMQEVFIKKKMVKLLMVIMIVLLEMLKLII